MFSPARWTAASTPSSAALSISPVPGFQNAEFEDKEDLFRLSSRTVSPLFVSVLTSSVPTIPVAPVIRTFKEQLLLKSLTVIPSMTSMTLPNVLLQLKGWRHSHQVALAFGRLHRHSVLPRSPASSLLQSVPN